MIVICSKATEEVVSVTGVVVAEIEVIGAVAAGVTGEAVGVQAGEEVEEEEDRIRINVLMC